MIIGIGVGEEATSTVPTIMRMMLTRAMHKSLDIALIFERANVAMKGNIAVNSTILTPARKERRKPAYEQRF